MEILDFDQLFYINVKALQLNNSHPSIKRDTKWILKFLLMHGVFTLVFCVIMYNMIYYSLKENDFSQTCKNGVICVVYVVVTFSYVIILWHQDTLKILIEMMRKDFALKTLEDRVLIFKYANMGKWVSKQWVAIAGSTFSCFPIKAIVLMVYYAATDEFRVIYMYELKFPEAIDNYKDRLFFYLIMNALFLYYGIYAVVMYVAFVPLGPTFMLHACGQLELVRMKVERLFREGNVDTGEEMREIAMQLQYVYSFVELINKCFRVAYELTLKATTIILPITCYEVIESFHHGELSIEFFTFIIGGVLISSSPCYYSNLLMEKGEEVRMAIYTCGWERIYDSGARASQLIMLTRALRTVAVRTMFRTVCLDALTDLFQQSYAIFNLMNAVWK